MGSAVLTSRCSLCLSVSRVPFTAILTAFARSLLAPTVRGAGALPPLVVRVARVQGQLSRADRLLLISVFTMHSIRLAVSKGRYLSSRQ